MSNRSGAGPVRAEGGEAVAGGDASSPASGTAGAGEETDQAPDGAAAAAVASCVFCRIVAGDLPAEQVAERRHALAFRDLHPSAPTHVLVVPKRHVDDAAAIDDSHGEALLDLMLLANEVAEREGVGDSGYRLVMNVGRDSGNSVGHLHLHVLGGRALGALG